MLADTEGQYEIVGEGVRAGGFFDYGSPEHTIQINTSNFTGRLFIEATLAVEPREEDWFTINLSQTVPYLQFPTAQVPRDQEENGETTQIAFTFEGNFVYLRARIERSYLGAEPQNSLETATRFGAIRSILLNY